MKEYEVSSRRQVPYKPRRPRPYGFLAAVLLVIVALNAIFLLLWRGQRTKTPTPTPTLPVTSVPTPPRETSTEAAQPGETPSPTIYVLPVTAPPTPVRQPTTAPAPTVPPKPTAPPTQAVTNTPIPVATATPTPAPTQTQTQTPSPTATATATMTPPPTWTPAPTSTPAPTETPPPTETPVPPSPTPGPISAGNSVIIVDQVDGSRFKVTIRLVDVNGQPAAGVQAEILYFPNTSPVTVAAPPPTDANGGAVGYVSCNERVTVTLEVHANGVTLMEKPVVSFNP